MDVMTLNDIGSPETKINPWSTKVDLALVCSDRFTEGWYQRIGAVTATRFRIRASNAEDLARQLGDTDKTIEGVLVLAGQDFDVGEVPAAVADADLDVPVVLGDLPAIAGARLVTASASPDVTSGFSEVIIPKGLDPLDDVRFTLDATRRVVINLNGPNGVSQTSASLL